MREKVVECIKWKEKVYKNKNVSSYLGQRKKRKRVILSETEGVQPKK